jgi:hypothetical protein
VSYVDTSGNSQCQVPRERAGSVEGAAEVPMAGEEGRKKLAKRWKLKVEKLRVRLWWAVAREDFGLDLE